MQKLSPHFFGSVIQKVALWNVYVGVREYYTAFNRDEKKINNKLQLDITIYKFIIKKEQFKMQN